MKSHKISATESSAPRVGDVVDSVKRYPLPIVWCQLEKKTFVLVILSCHTMAACMLDRELPVDGDDGNTAVTAVNPR